MNIPNILTFVRICLIPIFVWQFLLGNTVVAACILIISGITDVLDGYIARTYDLITKWGSVFDPVADKLTQLTVAFCIAMNGFKPMWIVFIFMAIKELVFAFGGIRLYKKSDTVVMAKWYGKVATFVFYCVFFVLIVFGKIMSQSIKIIIISVALAFSMLSLISYARNYVKISRKNEIGDFED